MIIPNEIKSRDRRLIDIMETCLDSIRDRRLLYERRRRWFLFGNDSEMPVRYNRLFSYTDLVSSFLFAPESLKFSLGVTSEEFPIDSDVATKLAAHLKTLCFDAEIIMDFSDNLLWSLCYDTMIMKAGWNNRHQMPDFMTVLPHAFGVYDETQTKLDNQKAFCHVFMMDREESVRRLYRAGKGDKIKELTELPKHKADDDYPPVYRSLIISQTGGTNVGGPVIGQAQAEYQVPSDFRGTLPPGMIEWKELWVWDTNSQDYRQFLIAGNDIVVEDSKDKIEGIKAIGGPKVKYSSDTNLFFPGEHPFVAITPYRMPDYFWGHCFVERCIRLQEWTNKRLEQIDNRLEKDDDPPKVFSGFQGLALEKAASFGGPHDWVFEPNSGAKVDELRDPPNPDLFQEFEKIGDLFLESAGLTQTVTGKGNPGVRSQEHAREMTKTGTGRIKKAALGLEPSLGRTGELVQMLVRYNDTSKMRSADGKQFVAGQIEQDMNVHVDGHSHSPLFADDTKELATLLMKFSAIEKKRFIRMLNPPDEESLVKEAEMMAAREAQQQGQANLTKAEDEAKRSHHKKGTPA